MPFPLACKVSAEKPAYSIMGVLFYERSCFSLAAFQSLSLSLTFDVLIVMCLGVVLFGFTLFGLLWASWTWVLFPSPG